MHLILPFSRNQKCLFSATSYLRVGTLGLAGLGLGLGLFLGLGAAGRVFMVQQSTYTRQQLLIIASPSTRALNINYSRLPRHDQFHLYSPSHLYNKLPAMRGLQLAITITQSLNAAITLLFLVLFARRLCKLVQIGVNNRFVDRYKTPRYAIVALYVLVSGAMLVVELGWGIDEEDTWARVLGSGSVGFGANSVILAMHVVVFSGELRREQSPSRLHFRFLVYLVLICFLRLALAIYQAVCSDNLTRYKIAMPCLAAFLVAISIGKLRYWLSKGKVMPVFDNLANADIHTITQKIANPLMIDHHSIYRQSSSSNGQKWKLIYPTLSVENGRFKIILEMLADDDILKNITLETKAYQLDSPVPRSTNSLKTRQHLQIISSQLYTDSEMQQIYHICCRFHLKNKVNFAQDTGAGLYRELKRFLQQLFTIKQAHTSEIYALFHIDKQTTEQLNYKVSKRIKSKSQLYVSPFVDPSAIFVSIQLYKHMQIYDHMVFYIHSVPMDGQQPAVCFRRYTDFEQLHHNLQQTVNSEARLNYLLPELPKKHSLAWNHTAKQFAEGRKRELQAYLREVTNNDDIMKKFPRSRELVLEFISFKHVIEITPQWRNLQQFYQNLGVIKGNIYNSLVEQGTVTFYEFQLYENGVKTGTIRKRFREFIALHEALEKWMHNLQILYKFVVLPEKHLYNSESKRHQKLQTYLENIVSIRELYKFYPANSFFMPGYRPPESEKTSNEGISMIRRKISESDEGNSQKIIEENPFDFSKESDRQRMSLLIEQLGDE